LEETAKLHFLLHGHNAKPLTPEQVAELGVVFKS
jgi:3-dehydro-4-phosphotetronate decarboxylase